MSDYGEEFRKLISKPKKKIKPIKTADDLIDQLIFICAFLIAILIIISFLSLVRIYV